METWEIVEKDDARGIKLRDVDRELYELPASAYGGTTKHDKDGRPVDVKLVKDRVLMFNRPGMRVAAKRLYTVKGEKPDGTVIQIPLEDQINNNIASPENAIGLRGYMRRGIDIFYDLETGVGAFCPTWDCWAEWNDEFQGWCSEEHYALSHGREVGEEETGMFGRGATTSRTWR